MNKYCLISIRPEHALNILNGSKTIELRKVVLKWVLEEISKGNTVKFLLYETFGTQKYVTEELWGDKYPDWYGYEIYKNGKRLITEGRGQVVASFDVNNIELVDFGNIKRFREIKKESCIEKYQDIYDYAESKKLYAIHISNLNVFDKPKELSDYYHFETEWVYSGMYSPYFDLVKTVLTKAPQNMMTVWSN